MTRQILQQVIYDRWCLIKTNSGTIAVQLDLIGKTLNPTAEDLSPFIDEGDFFTCQIVDGYGVQVAAPTYLGFEWTVFGTEEEAYRFLTKLLIKEAEV